jgi:small-conductance mechanosensitive channel
MFESFFSFLGSYAEYANTLLILVVFIVAAKIVTFAIGRYFSRFAEKTESSLDDMILHAVRGPLFIGILLAGVHYAISDLTLIMPYTGGISIVFTLIFGVYAAFFAIRIINTFIDWYGNEVANKTHTKIDKQFLPVFKKISFVIVFGLVFLWVLGQLGIQITTLIAAMGIGGLAIALAIQEPLSNFFSGANIIIDRPIRIGDYIEMDSGDKGTVIDIGWRSTKIRNYMNNIVAIPNGKLANSKIINYHAPNKDVGFSIGCGVAYGSDLDKVERIVLQVAKDVLKKNNGVESYEPKVRFNEFGDSAINFKVIMRTKSFGSQFKAKHEFIKALKKRFDKEKIVIPFPQIDVHKKR